MVSPLPRDRTRTEQFTYAGAIVNADLAVTKSAPATVTAGTNFNYTITVTNNGPSNATGVTVSDTLPSSVAFVSATFCLSSPSSLLRK